MLVFCLHVCRWTVYVPGTQRSSDPLELELRMVWTTVWVVGTKIESSAGTSVLHRPGITPVRRSFPNNQKRISFIMLSIILKCSAYLFLSFIHSLLSRCLGPAGMAFKCLPSQNSLSLFPYDLGIYLVPLAF